jgi:tetratricopeptide (TPR) repeat protein
VAASDAAIVSAALANLIDYHIVEADLNAFSISPPLWIAVERDSRFELPSHKEASILSVISEELTAKQDTDEISASMIDAAILATLQQGGELPPLFAALLLPSHLVWLARRRYNKKRLEECIQLARSALASVGRLSPAGKVEACRVLCLAAARRDQQDDFNVGIKALRADATDAWLRSNVNFLLGFNARMRGRFPEAEGLFRSAYEDSPGNFSAAHEIASICLARGNLGDAESFARQAFESAQDNAYILDILLRVLMARQQQEHKNSDDEIALLFNRLEGVGEEEGRSFYTTRRAEFEFGSLDEARKLIDNAVTKTP